MPRVQSFPLVFLEARQPLTKTIYPDHKEPYPMVRDFTSFEETVTTIKSYYDAVMKHAADPKGHCMLKGTIRKPLENESRAGSTDPVGLTHHLMLDFDGLKLPGDITTIDGVLNRLGFGGVSYFWQYSASHGHKLSKGQLNCHVGIILEEPLPAPLIKEWLVHQNFAQPWLREQLTLAKNGSALKYKLDTSASQNDKLIYIAPPIFKGMKDPLGDKRWGYKDKSKARGRLDGNFSIRKDEADRLKIINELRVEAGYAPRKNYTVAHNTGVLKDADPCRINGRKVERGFVYYNLNGGDSWGYHHPVDNPEVLYNFKGEPNYLLKDISEQYYESALKLKNDELRDQKEEVQGFTYEVGIDSLTSKYLCMKYDHEQDILHVEENTNRTQAIDFLKQHGQPVPDFFSRWDYRFKPNEETLFAPDRKFANRFVPSNYLYNADPSEIGGVAKIEAIIRHLLGNDDECFWHFINWLAYLIQKKETPRTAWVMHGTQGTGKDVLFNLILKPILGPKYVSEVNLQILNPEFNAFLHSKLMVAVNECDVSLLKSNDRKMVMGKVKTWVTERTLPFRLMYRDTFDDDNMSALIFFSNTRHAVDVELDDRRFNVAPRQEKKLIEIMEVGPPMERAIESELQAFTNFLAGHPVVEAKATYPLDNHARRQMATDTRYNLELPVHALKTGNLMFFYDWVRTETEFSQDDPGAPVVLRWFRAAMDAMEREEAHKMTRDEWRLVVEAATGQDQPKAGAFTRSMSHNGLALKAVRLNGKVQRGYETFWHMDEELLTIWKERINPKLEGIGDGRSKAGRTTRGSTKRDGSRNTTDETAKRARAKSRGAVQKNG